MTHTPIRIRAELHTSVRLGKIPVHLDALLWHALFLKTGCPESASDQLPSLLAESEGVYRASSLGFGTYPNERPVIATQMVTLGVMRQDTDMIPELMHPTGRKEKYSKIQIEGGPYKNRLTKYPTHHAPEIFWDAIGDGVAIGKLLNFYVLAVGLEANRGFGSVGEFQIEELKHDHSWVTETGELARVLPYRIIENLKSVQVDTTQRIVGRAKPPYHHQNNLETCVTPARVRKQPLIKRSLSQGI